MRKILMISVLFSSLILSSLSQASCLYAYRSKISNYNQGKHWEGLAQCFSLAGALCLPATIITVLPTYIMAKNEFVKSVKSEALIQQATNNHGQLLDDVMADFSIVKPNASRQMVIDLILNDEFCNDKDNYYSFDDILRYVYAHLPD